MPLKRRTSKARAFKITPEAIDAFAAGDHLRLHRALGLRPWEPSPLDEGQLHPSGSAYAGAWEAIRALRSDIREAMSPE